MTYYDDLINQFCGKCHYSCKSCRGPSDQDCENCFSDRDIYPIKKYPINDITLVKCKCISSLQQVDKKCVPKLFVVTDIDPYLVINTIYPILYYTNIILLIIFFATLIYIREKPLVDLVQFIVIFIQTPLYLNLRIYPSVLVWVYL